MHTGQFTKKNAAEMGKLGGLKTRRKKGKKYFRELALKRWGITNLSVKP